MANNIVIIAAVRALRRKPVRTFPLLIICSKELAEGLCRDSKTWFEAGSPKVADQGLGRAAIRLWHFRLTHLKSLVMLMNPLPL
jgi:hypothetical protein